MPLYTFKQHRSALLRWSEKMEKLDESFAQDQDTSAGPTEELPVSFEDATRKQVYPQRSMKWWWAKMNLRSMDGLPGLHTAHVTQVVPKASVHPVGAPEPPSDGTVVVLGNRVSKETMRALVVPASREEMVRLMLAVTFGVTIAAMYVQVFEPRC